MSLKLASKETLNAVGLLLMRVWLGSAMLFAHGWPKLASFSTRLNTFPDPLGVGSSASLVMAVFAEFFCSILIILGLGTRLAAVPLLIAMLVAAFIVHGSDPWAKKEFALLYAVPFLMLIFTGAGRFSIDRRIFK